MPLPDKLEKSLQATSTITTAELFTEGKSAANDPEEWPLAQISEVLDSRVCPLCAEVHGKLVAVDSPEYARWRAPSHINCRRVLVYVHRDEGRQPDFKEPAPELIAKHGHYLINPEKYAELRIPAEPSGRNVIVRRVRNLETGKLETRLEWAPWIEGQSQATKDLTLQARATRNPEELQTALEKLGLTDVTQPEQARKAVALGLKDRIDGFVTESVRRGDGGPVEPGESGEPAPGTPLGRAVSEALSMPRGQIADDWRAAVAALDSVHGDGVLPKIPVIDDRNLRGAAAYVYDPRSGAPLRIAVDDRETYQAMDLLHEIGHFLDHTALGSGGSFASETDPRLQPFRDAVAETDVVKGLEALLAHHDDLIHPSGRVTTAAEIREFAEYQLQGRELFARAYAQYIAVTSGDSLLEAQLQALIERPKTRPLVIPDHWEEADFAPILVALENLVVSLGWRK